MNLRILRGGRGVDRVAADDRGLAYGDGLFETLLVHEGRAVWWDAHWRRLRWGAERLRIALPDERVVAAEASDLIEGMTHGVLKCVLTRGSGGRGYAPPAEAEPMLVLSLHAPPAATPSQGLEVRWCDTRLALQPALAGIKHLNRLEQVLARAEWNEDYDEGLMLDMQGRVVAATAANVFVRRDGQWLTPPVAECGIAGVARRWMLDTDERVICATAGNVFARIGGRWLTPPVDRCGVAGVMREWLLAHVDGAAEAVLDRRAIETAEAVLICNSVRGLQPVRRIGQREWPDHGAVGELARLVLAREPAFGFSFAPWVGDNRPET